MNNHIKMNQEEKPGVISTANGFSDHTLDTKITKVYSVFDTAFEQNLLSNCFLSFNGGKDCTVLLDLLKTYWCERKNFKMDSIRIIYIQPENPFEEVEKFVDQCKKNYNINIERFQGNLRSVLEEICKSNPNLNAVIMGSRRSDPYCEGLKIFEPTDSDWPPLIRINPLLDWTTADIWKYIKHNNIEYCSLYDEGYTSLGDTTNTLQNPHLRIVDPKSGKIIYRPAYELLDDNLERAGRT